MKRRSTDYSMWLDISGLMLSLIFILALLVR
jgi:hypothetical protein